MSFSVVTGVSVLDHNWSVGRPAQFGGDRGSRRVCGLRGAAWSLKVSTQVGGLHFVGRAARQSLSGEVVVRGSQDQTAMAVSTVEQRKAAGRLNTGIQNGFSACISSNFELCSVLQQVLFNWITFFGRVLSASSSICLQRKCVISGSKNIKPQKNSNDVDPY